MARLAPTTTVVLAARDPCLILLLVPAVKMPQALVWRLPTVL